MAPTDSRSAYRNSSFDYSAPGTYYVTVCTRNRECMLAEIRGDACQLSPMGQIVADEWCNLRDRYADLELDEFVVMPNHLHGIVVITKRIERATNSQITPQVRATGRAGASPAPTGLSDAIGAFKSLADRRCREVFVDQFPGRRFGLLWQRSFYDHVIRNTADLQRIRAYIRNNVASWDQDEFNTQP